MSKQDIICTMSESQDSRRIHFIYKVITGLFSLFLHDFAENVSKPHGYSRVTVTWRAVVLDRTYKFSIEAALFMLAR